MSAVARGLIAIAGLVFWATPATFAHPGVGAAPLLFGTPFLAPTGDNPTSFALADFNGDGASDVAVACFGYPTGRIVLIQGRGDGTFAEFVPVAARDLGWDAITASDLNRDGRIDLVALHADSAFDIFLGNGDGTFAPPVSVAYPMGYWPASVVAADLNQDGNPDLAISSYGSAIFVLPGRGDGTFEPGYSVASGSRAAGFAVSDFDGNGIPDLVVADYAANGIAVLLGTGGGQFGDRLFLPAGYGPYDVAVGDLNHDGSADIAVANGGLSCSGYVVKTDSTVSIYLGDGSGGFTAASAVQVGIIPNSVSLTDIDLDGVVDLIVGNSLWGGVVCFFADNLGRSIPRVPAAAGLQAPLVPTAAAPRISGSPPWPGLSVFHGNGDGTFASTAFFTTTEAGTIVRVEDLDHNGRTDLIAPYKGTPNLSVFLANDDGSYGVGLEISVEEGPQHLLISDLNRDGLGDIAVACWDAGTVGIALGNTHDQVVPTNNSPAGDHPCFLAAGDLDRDGVLDLAVANFGEADTSLAIPRNGAVTILHGTGDGGFTELNQYQIDGNVNCVRIADLNEDGRPDIVAGIFSPPSVSVLLGNANGAFSAAQNYPFQGMWVSAVALGDFDADGHVDVAVSVVGNGISIVRGKGDGTLAGAEFTSPRGSGELQTADVNLDGWTDLISAPGYPAPIEIYLSNGDGTFRRPSAFAVGPQPRRIEVRDLNGDGLVDIATANLYSGSSNIYLGMGTGEFTRRVDYPAGDGPIAVATGDLNGDGRPDLAIANAGSNTVSIRWNRAEQGSWRTARAFLPGGSPAISAISGAPETCIRLESRNSSYSNADVYPPSISLESKGTGSASRIFALTQGPLIQSDEDGNGVMELPVCFASKDLARLFDRVEGMRIVNAALTGFLRTGEPLRAEIQLKLIGAAGGLRAYLAPTPSFGDATLYVSSTRFGHLTIRLFDVRGRLVRTLLDERFAPPGLHTARIDGQGRGGARLPSGLYFYRVEGADGVQTGRATILR